MDKAITLATPFHGSPLATPNWMKASFQQDSFFSWMRLGEGVAYRFTRQKFPYFEQDFHWDNVDQSLPPQFQSVMRKLPLGSFPKQLVMYGSYFGAPLQATQKLLDVLSIEESLVAELQAKSVLLTKHTLFSRIRRYIADLPQVPRQLGCPDDLPSFFQFNDGISPISSSLGLGRFLKNTGSPQDACRVFQQWQGLKSLKQSNQARLFPALDHRDWLEGTSRMKTRDVKDLLHPQENAKSLFEWLAADLTHL